MTAAPRPTGRPIAHAMMEFADLSDSEVAGARFPSGFAMPPLQVLTPLGLALAAERSRQVAALEKLRRALRSGVLAGYGFFPGDKARSPIPSEWWEGCCLEPANSSAKARDITVRDIVVCSGVTAGLAEQIGPTLSTSAEARSSRAKRGPKGTRTIDAAARMLAELQSKSRPARTPPEGGYEALANAYGLGSHTTAMTAWKKAMSEFVAICGALNSDN